jgi:GH15 family glucan-1,4-alpha-glucosidase
VTDPHTLREYALLADGERGALVGPTGEIAWLCFPGWADDGVFASLLGADSGYLVQPEGRFVWGGSYEPGGLIWRSRWVTTDGIVECREALALPTRRDSAVLLRRLEVIEGRVRVHVRLWPRARWGQDPVRDLRRGPDGAWRGRTGDIPFAWQGGPDAELDGFSLTLGAGERHDLVLMLGADGTLPDADEAWADTASAWRRRVPELGGTAADRDARHSVAVLSGLTSEGGGMVAAATTALPERADQGRSYDYRYAWIRDQCLAGEALAAAGIWPQFDSSVAFIRDRLLEHGPELAPAYTVGGRPIPGEHHLGLPGYPGGSDVAGNHVNEQFQLDAFGESLLLLATAARHDRLEADGVRAAERAAAAIADRWREPEAGIWELEPRHWTHSRLTCVAGLRAIAASAPRTAGSHRWLELADAILAETRSSARHPSGRWQRATDDPRIDAALLLAGARAAPDPADPITELTLRAVERELCDDGYCYRFQPDHRPLGEAEGAFLLCGFALALALLAAGDHVAAARIFDRNRSGSGPPGLLAEEFDVRQRQLRGNLPQAFVHGLLLQCAVALGPGSPRPA